MSAPADFEALKNQLIQIKPDLPKRLQQVAAFALDNPQEMALGTASSIAARARGAGLDAGALRAGDRLWRFFGSAGGCSARICATAGPIIPSG